MPSSGAIRAGAAYVEIMGDDASLSRTLAGSKAKMAAFNESVVEGTHAMFSKRGLFRAGAAGAGIYAGIHLVEGMADTFKEINEAQAEGPMSGSQKAARITEGVIKSIPVMGEVYTAVAKLTAELDGSAQKMRNFEQATEAAAKQRANFLLLREAVTAVGFSVRELQNELAKVKGQDTTASGINLNADKAADAVQQKMLKLTEDADKTGNRKSSVFKEAIANLKEMLTLIEQIRAAKLDEAVNAPAKATAEHTQALIDQLKGMLGPHGDLKHVSHAQAEYDKALAESQKPGGSPMTQQQRASAQRWVGAVDAAEAREAVDSFIESIEGGGKKVSSYQRALDHLIRDAEKRGTPLTQAEKDKAAMAVKSAETRDEHEQLAAEAKRMLEGAMTADEKRAATIAKLDDMQGRELITKEQRQKIIDAMDPARFEAHGTFNGSAMLGLQGGGGPMKETAEATKRTAKAIEHVDAKLSQADNLAFT